MMDELAYILISGGTPIKFLKRICAFLLAVALLLSCGEMLPIRASAATAVDSGTCGENLTWVKNAAASKYFIYRYRRVDGVWSEQYRKTIVGADTVTWTDTTTVVGETYRYVIVANKDGLSSMASEEVRIMRLGNTTLSLGAYSGRVRLQIRENPRATSYRIERREVIDAENEVYGKWEIVVYKTTELINWDETTEAGVTYEYRCNARYGDYISYGKPYNITAK